METVQEIVRRAELNFLQGNTKLGKYVNHSMHDTIERIDAYLNSAHISGETDSLGRPKPFFNIVSSAVNIWYRATDIDRKDIKFVPNSASSVVLALVANVMLQNWMDENRFGQFLNQWGRSLARYGSSVPKFVEKDGKLIPTVIPWNRLIADAVDFDALPRIEKIYYTPSQLRQHPEYDQDAVDALINAVQSRRTLDKLTKDTQNEFIEVYEVHGELDTRLLDKKPKLTIPNKDIKYRQQMHVVSFLEKDRPGEYDDYTLFKGKEGKDPYMKTDLIQEDGRTLSIGAVEYLFDAQWMVNHTAKNMKDTLDLASKMIFQTADSRYSSRNVLSAIETGDILVWDKQLGSELTQINTGKPDIQALQNFSQQWQTMAQDLTSTPDALRGNTLPSSTPYALGNLLSENASNLFELMTENKGLAIEDMMRTYVIPHLKKQLKHRDEIVAILDDAGVQQIDAMYIPREAIKRHNNRVKQQTFDAVDQLAQGGTPSPIQPFNQPQEEANVRQELGPLGNQRFLKPDDMGEKQWSELFSDFQWDNIRVQVTNENGDTKAVLATLSSLLQTIAPNPMILQDPTARMLFNQILIETGKISPLQLSTASSQPSPAQQQMQQQPQPQSQPQQGGGVGALQGLTQ